MYSFVNVNLHLMRKDKHRATQQSSRVSRDDDDDGDGEEVYYVLPS